MYKHFFGFILLALLLLASCKEEQMVSDSIRRLNISFADDQTRSSWNDKTDTEGGKVSYVWENSDNNNDNMLTAIKHSGQYVPFYESISSAAQYHTPTKFETVDDAKSKIKLQTKLGVKYDLADGEYVIPVAAEDDMYCCHPTNHLINISSGANAFSADMSIPSTFSYDKLVNDLSSLSSYSYVYTSTTLKSVDDNTVVANASHFNSACAIIRFNITNNVTSDIIITGIKMEADDGSKIFPNKLRFANGTMAEQEDKSGYYNRLTTDISSVTIPRNDKGIFYNMCFPLDGNFNNVPLKFIIDTNYLTYQLRLNSDVITGNKFEAGKIYTFNFSLEEKEIRLNTIDISRCTTYNVDNTESVEIVVPADVIWEQTGINSSQMVFVSLGMTTTIGDTEYDMLWATCNLGAREAIETGFLYAWGEVNRKADNLYSPDGYTASTVNSDISNTEHDVVKYSLGEGYWMWVTPTKEMWEQLMRECNLTWKPVQKVDHGGGGEENLDFDASVWEVKKTGADNKVEGVIYLPITGYCGLDETDNTYKKVNKARCCYWTSTPCSNEAGAKEKAFAFHTVYEIDTNDPSVGHMSAAALKECERYNGFAIRPVLLRRK